MKRTVMMMTLAVVVMSLTGCESCRRLFGLDRRCEQTPPQYYNAQPVYSGPANYAPAPGTCNTPK